MNDLSRTPLGDEEPSKEFGRFEQVAQAQAPVKVFLSGQAATDLIPLLKKLGSIEVVKEMPGDLLDEEVAKALTMLGFTPEHGSPAHTLREFERVGSALRAIGSCLNQSLEQFMNRPLEDYSGQTPTDLVKKHGAPALEALANDLAYPTPA